MAGLEAETVLPAGHRRQLGLGLRAGGRGLPTPSRWRLDRLPARVEPDPSVGAQELARDLRVDPRAGVDRGRMEGRQEAAHDQVVDPRLALRQRVEVGGARRGNDRVVIAHLGVVDVAAPQGRKAAREQPLGRLGVGSAGHRRHHRAQPGRDVPGQVAGVRARIGDQLALLVEGLRRLKRLVRRQPVAAVRLLLERGQVVQERRRDSLLAPSHLDDSPRLPREARHERAGLLLAAQTRGERRLSPRRSALGPLGLALVGQPQLAGPQLAAVEPACLPADRLAPTGAAPQLRGERRLDQPVGRRHEALDLLLAPHHERQGRGLHSPQRQQAAAAGGVAAGGVHADQPVGLRPTARGGSQGLELVPGSKSAQPGLDRARGERAQPQAARRLAAAGELIHVAEDQLPLAPRVAGVDHLVHASLTQQPAHDPPLVAGARAGAQLELLGEHRQVGRVPALPARVVLVRLGDLDQVPHAPRDPGLVPTEPPPRQESLAPLARAERGRDIAGHGGFLCDDERDHEGRLLNEART